MDSSLGVLGAQCLVDSKISSRAVMKLTRATRKTRKNGGGGGDSV